MLKQSQKRKDQQGFTIIEVLIVLAIAGLILLIVFLAVPALQRNARNTSRKSDVSRILGASQEVINNNSGSLAALTTANITTAIGTLGYYTAANVTVGAAVTSTTAANAATTDKVILYPSSTCAAMTGGQGVVKGTTRQVAVVYRLEANIPQCTGS